MLGELDFKLDAKKKEKVGVSLARQPFFLPGGYVRSYRYRALGHCGIGMRNTLCRWFGSVGDKTERTCRCAQSAECSMQTCRHAVTKLGACSLACQSLIDRFFLLLLLFLML